MNHQLFAKLRLLFAAKRSPCLLTSMSLHYLITHTTKRFKHEDQKFQIGRGKERKREEKIFFLQTPLHLYLKHKKLKIRFQLTINSQNINFTRYLLTFSRWRSWCLKSLAHNILLPFTMNLCKHNIFIIINSKLWTKHRKY